MKHFLAVALLVGLAACSGGSPTTPAVPHAASSIPTVTNQPLGLHPLSSIGPFGNPPCSQSRFATPGNTGNPDNNVACEGFDYTYTATFTELPAFSLSDPRLQNGMSYCVALFHSNTVGTSGPFTLDQPCLGSASGFVASNNTISSPTPTTNGFPQTVVPGKEYVLVLYLKNPQPPVVIPPTVTLGVGGLLNITIGGAGPFTVSGCNGLLNGALAGNILTVTGLLQGNCTLTITGPGGAITVPVTVGPTVAPILNPTSLLSLVIGTTSLVNVTGTGPFVVSGCGSLVNASVLNGTITIQALGVVGSCTLTVTGPTGSTTLPIITIL